MSASKISDPLVSVTIEKNREKLSLYSYELEALTITNRESHRKIDFLQKNLLGIESELQILTDRKNNILKELNSAKVTASLLDTRVKDLTESIAELNNSIHHLENHSISISHKTSNRGIFLTRMDEILQWEDLISLITPEYSKLKPIEDGQEISRMLRAYLIQQWFNLPLESLEETLSDSLSIREFVGNGSELQKVPTQSSIERFINFLEKNSLDKTIDQKIQLQLKNIGLNISSGQIVNATVNATVNRPAQSASFKTSINTAPKSAVQAYIDPNISKKESQTAESKHKLNPNTSANTPTKVNTSLSTPSSKANVSNPKIKKNKLTFFDYLSAYGEPKKLITDIITEFHALVVEKKETRHYLFNANIDNLIADQNNFLAYIFPKEKITQNNPITQTAPPNMRIGVGTFDEITNILTYLLVDNFKMERKTAPTAAAHIIELIEETRCQIEDTNHTVWKPIELKASLLEHFFSMKGFICRSISQFEVAILGGLEFPLNLLIDANSRSLVLKGICKSNDWATLDDLSHLKETLNREVVSLNFEVNVIDQKPVLTTQYYLPYSRGVPNRLLLKACKSFTTAIAKGLEKDENNLMIKPTN